MNASELLEKIVGRQQKRNQQRITSFRELVMAIADGHEPDETLLERTLADAGKSIEDLSQAVEVYLRRSTMKAMVARVPELEAEQAELRKQIEAADKVLEGAERQHDEVTSPLYFRLQEIKQGLSDASSARSELFHTCNDPDLRRELDQLNSEAEKLSQQRQELHQRANYMTSKAESELVRANRELNEGDIEHRREQSSKYKHHANLARRQLAALEQANAELLTQREHIEEKMRMA